MTASWRLALGDQRLLVSGFGRWGGGVYDVSTGTPVALDDIPTSGLALGGERLWRALRAPGEQTAACELLSYDERGVRTYERYDAIRDPHDICWHGGALHVSSSWDGIVWRTAPGTTPTVAWRGGRVPDSWHVNSLLDIDGALHVCAFGRLDVHKGWRSDGDAATGFVHDTRRGIDVLGGLAHPHHPRWTGDRWLLCESTRGCLTECAPDGRVLRRLGIGRFSRGLTVVGDQAVVGGNAHRADKDDRAEVVVVDLDGFAIVDRLPMPCLEIYDILPVPQALARGLAVGFGANPSRAVEQHRGDSRAADRRPAPPSAHVRLVAPRMATRIAATGELLESSAAARCGVRGTLPTRALHAGELRSVMVTVENHSTLELATVAPHPIRVGARWIRLDEPADTGGEHTGGEDTGADDTRSEHAGGGDAGGEDAGGGHDQPGGAHRVATGDGAAADGAGRTRQGGQRGPLTALPRLLHPGDRAEVEVLLLAPDDPGRYEVRVALHQTGRGWFGRRVKVHLDVEPAPAAGAEPGGAATAEPGTAAEPAGSAAAEGARPGSSVVPDVAVADAPLAEAAATEVPGAGGGQPRGSVIRP